MFELSRWTLAVLLVIASTLAFANKEHKLERVIELSGLSAQLKEIPANLDAQLSQMSQGDDPEFDQVMRDSASKHFKPSGIEKVVQSHLSQELSNSDLDMLLDWYRSDLGQRISYLEVEASKPAAYQYVVQNHQSLILENPERAERAVRFDELVGSTEMLLKIERTSSVKMVQAIMPGQSEVIQVVEQQLESTLPQRRQTYQTLNTAGFIYGYRDLSEFELDTYERFLEQPAATRFMKASMNGLIMGMENSMEQLALEIKRAYQ